MALLSPVKSLIICVIILCHVPSSFQQCPNNIVIPPVSEGQGSKDHVLCSISSVTSLNVSVTNNDGPYLAVNTTHSNGTTDSVLYIAKEIDVEGTPYSYDVIVPVIPVNEFAPEFIDPPYNQTVPENSQRGTSVFSFANRAEDPDYTEPSVGLSFGIVDNISPFIIEDSETVIVNGSLDFDNGQRAYILNISVEERIPSGMINYTTLTITLSDSDDLGPAFSPTSIFYLVFPEGDYNGVVFNTHPTLTAKDRDTLNDSVQLELDQTSQSLAGKLTVLNNGSINVTGTFLPGQFTFNVRAFQTNRPSDRFAIASVSVTVYDINNHDPVMSSAVYSGSVLESAPPGTVVLTVSAFDMDQGVNGSFQFQLYDTSVPFIISTDRTIGILRVKEPLDRETVQSYTLYVYAHEDESAEGRSSNISVVTVTVLDVNDNSPVLDRAFYTFAVDETDTAGSVVGQIGAIDADGGVNGQITFSITSTDVGPFVLDSTSGVLWCNGSLDFNVRQHYTLVVTATDGGYPPLSTSSTVSIYVIDINNEIPKFTGTLTGSVSEDAQQGTTVLQLQAEDEDTPSADLSYTLENVDPAGWVSLSGRFVITNSPLDAESAHFITATVTVSDGVNSASRVLNISVLDVNDNSPQSTAKVSVDDASDPPWFHNSTYTFHVTEGPDGVGSQLMVSASEYDAGNLAILTYSILSCHSLPLCPLTCRAVTKDCHSCLLWTSLCTVFQV